MQIPTFFTHMQIPTIRLQSVYTECPIVISYVLRYVTYIFSGVMVSDVYPIRWDGFVTDRFVDVGITKITYQYNVIEC